MNKKQKALQEFLKTARQNHGDKIEKIILFGSLARGEAREESDIDILVITSGNRFEMQKNLSGIAVDILLKTGEYILAKAVTTEEYSFMKKINTGFYRNIAKNIFPKTHRGVIARLGLEFVKEGIIEEYHLKAMSTAKETRERADYGAGYEFTASK